jgi:hypothetical protein
MIRCGAGLEHVSGVPMMNGCSILEGYVPEIDAMVVQPSMLAARSLARLCAGVCLHTSQQAMLE